MISHKIDLSNLSKLVQALRWHNDLNIDHLYREKGQISIKLLLKEINAIVNNYDLMKKKHVDSQIVERANNNINNKNVSHSCYDKIKTCNSVAQLRTLVNNFDDCALKLSAKRTVFSDGNPDAEIMLIGEGPGANEDEQGIPFCGQSGKLLDNALKSIDLDREKIYITNTVFWRPPGNRKPTKEELDMCRPFMEKHISLINPKLLVLVGGTAAESVLNIDKVSVNAMRGRYYDYRNEFMNKSVKVITIFHPSYLLRQQSKKSEMWLDMLRIDNFIAEHNASL